MLARGAPAPRRPGLPSRTRTRSWKGRARRAHRAPVMTETVPSTCNFPFMHPLYAGPMPRLGPQIKAALMRHDLLFSVGGDLFTLSLPSDVDPMPDGLDVVHIDVDPWELGKNYAAKVAIQGDPKATLPEPSKRSAPLRPTHRTPRLRDLSAAQAERTASRRQAKRLCPLSPAPAAVRRRCRRRHVVEFPSRRRRRAHLLPARCQELSSSRRRIVWGPPAALAEARVPCAPGRASATSAHVHQPACGRGANPSRRLSSHNASYRSQASHSP